MRDQKIDRPVSWDAKKVSKKRNAERLVSLFEAFQGKNKPRSYSEEIKMIRKLELLVLSGLMCILALTPAWAVKYNEAPMLKVKVAAGELPPVEQRLPDEPQIVKPIEEIGQYGGTAHVFDTMANAPGDGAYLAGFEPLFRIAPDCKTIISNIVREWELSKDMKTLTLYLRKGIKWSDGVNLTADDMMFWYEDIFLNDELTPVKNQNFCPGNEPMKVEKVNDYTVRLCFAAPCPTIEVTLCGYQGIGLVQPKHYLGQFHLKYNPEADNLAKEKGLNAWYEYFNERRGTWQGVPQVLELPIIGAFKLVEKRVGYLLYERNPYYWKVDTEGNQLPYIDRIITGKVENVELYNGKIISGESDFGMRRTFFEDFPLFKDSARKANYQVYLWKYTNQSFPVYQPNQTHKDPILRKIFRDVRFRRGLSLAINREEINEDIHFGKAVPGQMTVLPSSKYYKPEFETAYAQYDPEEANRLLDEMGLSWDKNHEYRLRSDGKKLGWTLEYLDEAVTSTNELVKEYWKEIGCDVTMKLITGELQGVRAPSNDMDMTLWGNDKASDFLFPLTPQLFVPYSLGWETSWGVEWARWYTSEGKEGEEPPENVKKLYEWWEELKITVGEENIRLGRNILASQAENLWGIGTVGMFPRPVITKSNLRNVPEIYLYGWDLLYTMPCPPEQFFFEHPLFPSQK
ncbi:Periplasmic alpha-galactoside-binding protein [subsurface metagenome]